MQETNVISEVYKKEILEGLTSAPKYIPSKYFYDVEGSRIFQDIMRMPEYYLTDCEYEILQKHKSDILKNIRKQDNRFDLVELGAGDGLKTGVLIEYFLHQDADFIYVPVDISEDALMKLVNKMRMNFQGLTITELAGDYFRVLSDLNYCDHCQKIALFLGSNIGNYNFEDAKKFLFQLSSVLNKADKVLIGFDLVKDPEVILKAYNDPHGNSRKFNLNLLQRINRELGADFDTDNFLHYPLYDPAMNAAKSYLISKKKQNIFISELDTHIAFDKWEHIYTEMSQKFTPSVIASLAEQTGYKIVENYYDDQVYFVDSLWEKI